MASCARRPGRNPYEKGWKSSSKMGSSTILSAACTTRSRTVGMPSRRNLPLALGIILSRTGWGWNSLRRSPSRQVVEERLDAPLLNVFDSHAIDTGAARALVVSHQLPSHDEEGRVADEVVEVVELAIVIFAGPTLQLGLHPQYLGLRLVRRWPSCAGVHRRPPALAARSLRGRCLPSPCGRLSRPRTTTQAPPRPAPTGDGSSRIRPGRSGSGERKALPRFTVNRSTGWVPNFAPATSPRVRRSPSPWPPLRQRQPLQESPSAWACVASRPSSSGFEPAPIEEALQRWFLTYTSLSRSPSPRRPEVPARPGFVRAAPAPTGVPAQAALGFMRLLRQANGGHLRPLGCVAQNGHDHWSHDPGQGTTG